MDYQTAVLIERAAVQLGFDFEAREHYQGRNFYKGAALVYTNENELMKAVALAAIYVYRTKSDYNEFLENLPNKRDNLGKQMIAY